jgi:hypothetical protein
MDGFSALRSRRDWHSPERSASAVITSFCAGVTGSAQAQSRAPRLTSGPSRNGAAQQRQDQTGA